MQLQMKLAKKYIAWLKTLRRDKVLSNLKNAAISYSNHPSKKGVKMKIKTSELNGRALDWATAVADGFEADYLKRNPDTIPEYSEYWNDCGDLITEHEINLSNEDGEWFASLAPHMNECIQSGETPQIAICRAVVVSELGDEVDIPDELVGENGS